MGSGASTGKDTLKPLLLSHELEDGGTALVSDLSFRVSFTNYIKSGIWLDRLSRLVPESQLASIGEAGTGNSNVTKDLQKSVAMNASSKSEASPKASLYTSSKSTAMDDYVGLYSNDAGSFSPEELLVIFLTIIYPIYLSSQEYVRFVKYGIEQGNSVQDDNSSRSVASNNHQSTRMVQTNSSKRAQELLLSCAAYHDELFLQEYLQKTIWLQRVCAIFRDHPVALCITDTANGGMLILFANKAFCGKFGFTEAELIGNDFSMLCGRNTETPQLSLMRSSIHSTETVKFSITLQSKAKKPLLDLVAQKAVGAYSVSAHFVAKKSMQLDAVNMVEDVLLFLSYLVKAPALPTRPSWLPAPIVILTHVASNVLHGVSPSSARSHSSSIRHPPRRSGGGGGKGGTPSSVRSFNSSHRANSGGSGNSSSYRSARDGAEKFLRSALGSENNSGPRSVRSSNASDMDSAGRLVSVVPGGAVETVLEETERPHK